MNNVLRKIISINLCLMVISSFFISNCSAMMFPMNTHFIKDPYQSIVVGPHTKYEPSEGTWEHTYSWVSIGVDIALLASGGAGNAAKAVKEGVTAVKYARLSQSALPLVKSMAEKQLAKELALAGAFKKVSVSLGWGAGALGALGYVTNDLTKTHGIKVTVRYRFKKGTPCNCKIGKDHGDTSLFEVISTKFEIV